MSFPFPFNFATICLNLPFLIPTKSPNSPLSNGTNISGIAAIVGILWLNWDAHAKFNFVPIIVIAISCVPSPRPLYVSLSYYVDICSNSHNKKQ